MRARLILVDRERRFVRVHLTTELEKRISPRALGWRNGAWSVTVEKLPLDRLEYAFEGELRGGKRVRVLEPSAPIVDHGIEVNVTHGRRYRPPRFLGLRPARHVARSFEIAGAHEGGRHVVTIHSPAELPRSAEAPLLVVHDGDAYVRHAELTTYIFGKIAAGDLPPCRIATLNSADRLENYAASPAYVRAFRAEILPRLSNEAPHTVRAGLGASLGALAMAHLEHELPRTFSLLALQSGSFFTPELDSMEAGFRHFGRITRFVAELRTRTLGASIRLRLTVGGAEENAGNNGALVRDLQVRGGDIELFHIRDLHTWTCFRDGLERALADLPRVFRQS